MHDYVRSYISHLKQDHTPTLALVYYGLMHIGFAQEDSIPFDNVISATAMVGYVSSAISGLRGRFRSTMIASATSSVGILCAIYDTPNIESLVALTVGMMPPLLLHKPTSIDYLTVYDPDPLKNPGNLVEFPVHEPRKLRDAA